MGAAGWILKTGCEYLVGRNANPHHKYYSKTTAAARAQKQKKHHLYKMDIDYLLVLESFNLFCTYTLLLHICIYLYVYTSPLVRGRKAPAPLKTGWPTGHSFRGTTDT